MCVCKRKSNHIESVSAMSPKWLILFLLLSQFFPFLCRTAPPISVGRHIFYFFRPFYSILCQCDRPPIRFVPMPTPVCVSRQKKSVPQHRKEEVEKEWKTTQNWIVLHLPARFFGRAAEHIPPAAMERFLIRLILSYRSDLKAHATESGWLHHNKRHTTHPHPAHHHSG